LTVHERTGWLWLFVVLLCLIVVCLGQFLEIVLAPSTASHEPGSKRHPAGESRRPPGVEAESTAQVLPPTNAAPAESDVPEQGPIDGGVTLTVVYDNHPYDGRLTAAWGFACWIETPHGVVLFDTGGDGTVLLGNLQALGLDARRIDAVVLSHNHSDHIGGLDALLDLNSDMIVYVPRSFPRDFVDRVAGRASVMEVTGPREILSGVFTTGEIGNGIVEQSLIVESARGLLVLTGCAHPGIARIVGQAAEQGRVYLVMGGFHLSALGRSEARRVAEELKALGVMMVAPCHCTGEAAIGEFADAFGSGFLQTGVGSEVAIRK
jgi:7,8-dihydropterin-6-yl-methyl-4-(beta-D-ribofuranosyl)aminobenzene 5'-phosphate synthase